MFEFLTILGAAVVLKLLSSADDVIWLAKLFEGMRGLRLFLIQSVYIGTVCLVCLLAWVLAALGSAGFMALTGDAGWFSLTGSVLLFLFAVTVLRHEEEEALQLDSDQALHQRLRDACVISFIGSLDELAVYTVALSTGEIRLSALLSGTVIAAGLTLLVVAGVRHVRLVTELLEKIPIWVIIALLGLAGMSYSAWQLPR